MSSIEILISGRVQGVYLRKTIQSYAQELRVNGYIENMNDGSVYIMAQAKDNILDIFIQKCKKGSLLSKIDVFKVAGLPQEIVIFTNFTINKKHSFIKDQINSFSHLKKNIMKTTTTNIMNIPEHIVIIPNGNRTWAKKRGLKAWEGYWETYKNMGSIVKEAQSLGVSHLTLWGFSTENWKRDIEEISELFKMVSLLVKKLEKSLQKEKIRFNHFGRKDRIPKELMDSIIRLEESTKQFSGKSINLALDYGGRDEIIRAVNTLLKSDKKEITEAEFSQYLDTKNVPDPDLIIRTSNEKRLSGMMPWQSTYAEYYFTDILFPEFKGKNLNDAVRDFSGRKRTFGGDIDNNKNTT